MICRLSQTFTFDRTGMSQRQAEMPLICKGAGHVVLTSRVLVSGENGNTMMTTVVTAMMAVVVDMAF